VHAPNGEGRPGHQFAVTAGEPVRLVLTNEGTLEHDFSITEFPMETNSAETGPGVPLLEGASEITLIVRDAVASERVFSWTLSP
jgi:uncharacterized cupredoxin-like copper-binding protein